MPAAPAILRAAETAGVTATEIRIGNTMPYSGPASAYATIGKADAAVFKMLNDMGGFGGRKVNFISYDDSYSPPKTVEQTRRLVEQDSVACLFNCLGTATQTSVMRYTNQKKVPNLFISSGAEKWADREERPWTIGWQPSYKVEAEIYAQYILKQKPGTKVGMLVQNDDFGRDYVDGFKAVLKDAFDKMVVQATYETADPTVDSQLVTLQGAAPDILVTIATPKFAAQAIRKVAQLNWKPMHLLTNVSVSVGAVMQPAGMENGIGIISSAYAKDPTDPAWDNDAGMQQWRAFMAKYYPEGDVKDAGNLFGFGISLTMGQVLKQCGTDFSRENLMKQATSLDYECPVLLPGIRVQTTSTDYHPIKGVQLMRWTGKTWERFGDVIRQTAT